MPPALQALGWNAKGTEATDSQNALSGHYLIKCSGGTESITGFFQMMKPRPKDINDTSMAESEFEPGVMLILVQYGLAA